VHLHRLQGPGKPPSMGQLQQWPTHYGQGCAMKV
jgi:hypothetical protein